MENNKENKLIDKLKYFACSLRERILLFYYFKAHPEVTITNYGLWSGYSPYDAVVMSGSNINKLVEVKFREFYSKQFNTTFIEQNKFNTLRELAYEFDQPVEYWNFYSRDGILEVFNLNNVEYFESNIKRGGKECFDSEVDDESTLYELDKSFASYYKFDTSVNYNQLAKVEMQKRFPEHSDKIKTFDLSKFQSYLYRKNNAK